MKSQTNFVLLSLIAFALLAGCLEDPEEIPCKSTATKNFCKKLAGCKHDKIKLFNFENEVYCCNITNAELIKYDDCRDEYTKLVNTVDSMLCNGIDEYIDGNTSIMEIGKATSSKAYLKFMKCTGMLDECGGECGDDEICENGRCVVVVSPASCQMNCLDGMVCIDDECVPLKEECVNHCDGDTLVLCKSNGEITEKYCSNGCDNDKLECIQCSESYCDNSTLIRCNSDGSTTPVDCPDGCDAEKKQCIEVVTQPCVEQCQNNVLTLCDSNGKPISADCGSKKCNLETRSCGIELNPVPSGQNNTEGAECNIDTFVEYCDGNSAVYCGYEYDEKTDTERYKVEYYVCEKNSLCMTALNREMRNYSNCIEPNDVCTTENSTDYYCEILPFEGEDESNDEGYVYQYKYNCSYWSDGKLHWVYDELDSSYCSTACVDGSGCQFNACIPGAASSCSDNLAVNCDWDEWSGQYHYYAMNCGSKNMCRLAKDYSYCDER